MHLLVHNRVRVDGEYGGLGLVLEGNPWPGRPEAYEMADSPARLTQRYVEVSRTGGDCPGRGYPPRTTPRPPMRKTGSTDSSL